MKYEPSTMTLPPTVVFEKPVLNLIQYLECSGI